MADDTPGAVHTGLVDLNTVCSELGLDSSEVYLLMSTRQLPASLIGGRWRFDMDLVRQWMARRGGRDAVRVDAARQVVKHARAGESRAAPDRTMT